MTFPSPHPGLVIRHSYLWKQEAESGREEGSKDRPCAIVMAVIDEDGEQRVLVLPITHSPPGNPADAIDSRLDQDALGLDSDRSWRPMSLFGPDQIFAQ